MSESSGGLLGSLRGLAVHAVEVLQNRVELMLTEIEEEKERLLRTLALGAAAVFLLSAGVVFLAIFLTVLFWEEHRLLTLGLLAGFFFIAGFASLVGASRQTRRTSKLLGASRDELARDKAALKGHLSP
ncbi:MAG: phage holin family protein [Rhodocyclaceae bacterium]|jgi:uncharacterized membrane protein YqjE|nr:phage holin family protein [Rhodocyclaceae bacterium]